MNFQDKVKRAWDRMNQRQRNQLKSTGERIEVNIISNIEDYRGIYIKAVDGDEDRTVIASNTWEEHAMYAGRDGHHEELGQYDPWNNSYSRPDDEWDDSWAENDPEPLMYNEHQYQCPPPPKMPQPTIEMESNRWQPNWSNAQYADRGAAWQTICKQPWVQQTRRMSRDDRYTPENMTTKRIPPKLAGILFDKQNSSSHKVWQMQDARQQL